MALSHLQASGEASKVEITSHGEHWRINEIAYRPGNDLDLDHLIDLYHASDDNIRTIRASNRFVDHSSVGFLETAFSCCLFSL